jgi:two-component system, sensor histidine kinase and response regulator
MTRLNKYGEDFIGYTQEEIAQEPYFWIRFIPEELKHKVANIIEKARKGNLIHNFQNAWISKTKELRYFEWANHLIQTPQGEMKYIVTIGIDITEQKRKQEKIEQISSDLEKKQIFLETLLDNAPIPIFFKDTQGKYIGLNNSYAQMLGFQKSDIIDYWKNCF